MRVLDTARVLRKGMITIPKSIRERLTLAEGDILVFKEEDGKIIIQKASALPEFCHGVLEERRDGSNEEN